MNSEQEVVKSRATGYASPSIRARRYRILDEARRMIGEVGLANLSMDEVACRAGVAKRTLYNAFESKERLVAAAINKYFQDYAERLTFASEEATLEWVIERLTVVGRRNMAIRNYIRALMNIYHAHDIDPTIRSAIHTIAADSHGPWIRSLEKKRQLQPWVDADELVNALVRYRYATAHAWAEGLITDNVFLHTLICGLLTFVAGATRGAARKEIEQTLLTLRDHPRLKGD
ncbi:MAG: TetR/AcrR family transcriptional regulator [Sphingobium sp.]|nr:TetR/AcrR family transcriptional regulator [Sphingobium sp.]MBP9158524.1 TetR/AcrR family transcriptional regulator [Sphingobium sp.]